jgi:hypothetical protein
MDFIRKQDVDFRSAVSLAIISLIVEDKKRSPKNISIKSGYSMKEIELNLYDIGLICETLEDLKGVS